MEPLSVPNSHHLQAAQGWLELGNWVEASRELESITPQLRAHPDVLCIRCKIFCDAGKWDHAAEVANVLCTLLPESAFGPLHLAHALRKLDRIAEARDTLLPVADKFPAEWRFAYQLSCYTCRLGELKQAYSWLEKAIDVAGRADIRQKALDDPDLEPLWTEIGSI